MKVTAAQVAAMLKKPAGRIRNVAPRSERTYSGIVYDSKSEALYAFKLDSLKATGDIFDWVRQIRIPLFVKEVKVCTFIIDFQVHYANGDVQFHEVKGWETPEYKLKLKLFKALYPDADYRIVKV